eukprot:Nitzschia sp. Nitz4//scaffold198_size39746//16290//17276//NITZ4_007601-RA/size39746-processed-gene-0.43-mRNA-1//-1//CDS//3329540518//6682//frame0
MKVFAPAVLAFFFSFEQHAGVLGAPLSTKAPSTKAPTTKAPKSTKAPSAMPSMSPDPCGDSCVAPQICMLTFQEEGTIIEVGSSSLQYPPLGAPGTYRICPAGDGDCEVPASYQDTGASAGCRTPGNGTSVVQTSCMAADAVATSTYACSYSNNTGALGEFAVFSCPGDSRCYTSAPTSAPSPAPTKSAKKSATFAPTVYLDPCNNACTSPEICMLTYQKQGITIVPGSSVPVNTTAPLGKGTYRACPACMGDCVVPASYMTSGASAGCRLDQGTGTVVQTNCTAAAAEANSTYACAANFTNSAAGGSMELFACESADSRCASSTRKK